MTPMQIPGFYYDEEKGKYFKIINGGLPATSQVNKYHNNSVQAEKRRKDYHNEASRKKYKSVEARNRATSIAKQAFQVSFERRQFELSHEGLLRLKTGTHARALSFNRSDMLDFIPGQDLVGFQEHSGIESARATPPDPSSKRPDPSAAIPNSQALPLIQRVPKSYKKILGVFGKWVVMIPSFEPDRKSLIRFWDGANKIQDIPEWNICRDEIVSLLNFHCTAYAHNTKPESSSGFLLYSFREIFEDNGANILQLKHVDIANDFEITNVTCKLRLFLREYVPKHYKGQEGEISKLFGFRVSALKRREGNISEDIDEINSKLEKSSVQEKNAVAQRFVNSMDINRYEIMSYHPVHSCQSSVNACAITDDEIILSTDKLDVMRITFTWNEADKTIKFHTFDFLSFSPEKTYDYDFRGMYINGDLVHTYCANGILTMHKSDFEVKKIRPHILKVSKLRMTYLLSPTKMLVLHDQKISIVRFGVDVEGSIHYRDIDQVLGTFFTDNNPFQSFCLANDHLLINETENEIKVINMSRSFENGSNSKKIHVVSPPTRCPARRNRLKNIINVDGKFHLVYDL